MGNEQPGSWPSLASLLRLPKAAVDPANQRKAERLHTILVALCIMSFTYAIFYVVVSLRQLELNLIILVISTSNFLLAWALLRRGYFTVATWMAVGYIYVAIPLIALGFDGIYDTSLTAYFLLIAIVGLIRGGRAAFVTASFAAFALIAVYVADLLSGGVRPPVQPPFLRVVEMAGFLLLVGLVLRMTLGDLNQALNRAREEVAERKRVEAALVEARDQLEERVAERTVALTRANRDLETLIETSQDGVLFMTGEGKLTVVNSRALELLQLPGDPDEWEGRGASDLVEQFMASAPEEWPSLAAAIDKIRDSAAKIDEGEMALLGSYLHWYQAPANVGAEAPARLVVLRDVTAQRQAEQMRNDLISTMVHDLRNPLTSMLSLLSTLAWMDKEGRDDLSSRQRRYVERSMETVRQMNQLVSNILDVSRLESGQMPLQAEAVPLPNIIMEMVSSQRPLAAEKSVRLIADIPATLPPAWADVGLLERILQNLLDNAIKFTPAGGEVRVLAAYDDDPDPGHLRIAVADTGPGIDDALMEKLFQKFVAGDREGAGSGLGLAFSKLAVEAHGGQIEVESEVGSGTVFTFTLPPAPSGS